MTRNRKLAVGAGLGVAILGLGGLALASNREKGTEVRTEVVSRRDLTSIVTASGKIEPKRQVQISADVPGRVVQLAVQEGQMVRQGDLLLRIDPTSYQAAVRRAEAAVSQAEASAAQARANLIQARSGLQRAETLGRQGTDLISAEALEQARTQANVAQAQYEAGRFGISQAQAALAEAREQLRKTTITAPMSGRVTRLNIEEGETAVMGTMNNPGSLLLTIADLSVMEARVKVDETDVPRISIGDSASLRIDAFPNQTFSGTVTRISNSALQTAAGAVGAAAGGQSGAQSVDFEVLITLRTPPADLRPDLSATADIVTARRPNALSVPILSLTIRDPDGKKPQQSSPDDAPPGTTPTAQRRDAREVEGVFMVRDGKAVWAPVGVGVVGEQYFEVTSGLTGGETVVAGSYQAIRDLQNGDAVKVPPLPKERSGTRASTEKSR